MVGDVVHVGFESAGGRASGKVGHIVFVDDFLVEHAVVVDSVDSVVGELCSREFWAS